MKQFFKNQDNIIILGISLIAFIVGCLAIGLLKTILIIGIADILFFLPNILKKKKKRKKEPKAKQEKKKKKIWKILLFIFLIVCTFIIIACISFAIYIIKEAPKFTPDDLYKMEPTTLYGSNGTEMGNLGAEKRDNITYDDLPEVLIDAIIATEDSRFFQHNGFDLARFLKASVQQVLTGGGGGASTLTMQVVKNTFTSTTSTGFEGIKRKFTDIYMSVFQVEKKYTKKEILEFYVNSYYLGSGAYGVEQASKNYFGKAAKDMNLVEAALIAGLFQAPNAYDPYQHPDKAEQRRNQVLKLMKRHEYITQEEYETATSISVEEMLVTKEEHSGENEYQGFIDMVVNDVIEYFKSQNPDSTIDPYTTSMQIYTTMDIEKQNHINKIMNSETYTWQNDLVDAGISVQDVNTGAVLAIGAGRHRNGERQRVNATQIKRQIGSTSKPLYDYAPGIEYENWSTYQLFVDEPYAYSDGTQINNWDRKYNGLMTMRTALAQSRNIPALKAFQANKNENISKFVQSVGLHPEGNGILHEAHSIGGYTGENPRGMAAAYASFANGGYYIEPYSFTKIVLNETGETIEPTHNKTRVMSEETAYIMTSLLQSAAQYGLGNQYHIGGAIYGAKTGTSNYDAKTAQKFGENAVNDLWVNGVSPDYAISVWYGYQDLNRTVSSTSYTIAHRTLFQAVAKGVFKNGSNWTKPEGVVEVQVEMGSWPAKLPSEYTPSDMIVTELFKSGTEPTEISDRYSKLSDVTDLTSTVNNNKLTLKWTAIKTPNAINNDYLNNYFSTLYRDESYKQNALSTRLSQNNSTFGKLVYKIYSKNSNGTLTYIKETSDTNITIDLTPTSPTTYVVKSAYTAFSQNASDGVSTTISLENVKGKVTAKLKGKETEEIIKGTVYKISNTDVTVLEDSTDVTNKAKITFTLDGKTVSGTNTTLDTTVVGTHTIKYTITYNNETITLNKTVKVIEKTN